MSHAQQIQPLRPDEETPDALPVKPQELWRRFIKLISTYRWISIPACIPFGYFLLLAFLSIGARTPLSPWAKERMPLFFEWFKSLHDLFHNERGFHVHEILLGLGGIAIGVFIALIIEDAKSEKEKQLLRQTSQIHKATQNLQQLHTQLTERIETNVKKIENYTKLLEEIGRVIDAANRKDGDLLMMNLTASFGYFMTFDADKVLQLEHLDPAELHKLRCQKLNGTAPIKYFAEHTILSSKQKENDTKLAACAPTKKADNAGTIQYLTLSTNGDDKSPFLKDYLEPSLRGAIVKGYDSCSRTNFSITDAPSVNKLYLIPEKLISGGTAKSEAEMKKAFEQHLIAEQNKMIEQLESNQVTVKAIPQIPFQLYVWLPQNRNEAGRGVFMFVNQHTLARTNYTAAFWTENREVLETFKAMFESVRDQEVRISSQEATPGTPENKEVL